MSGVILSINKETMSLGMPWEKEYGYSQAAKIGDTIYVSDQVAHDDNGKIVGKGEMEAQMRQAYSNIHKVLAQYGATMDNIVDETLFVTDMDSAFAAAFDQSIERWTARWEQRRLHGMVLRNRIAPTALLLSVLLAAAVIAGGTLVATRRSVG